MGLGLGWRYILTPDHPAPEANDPEPLDQTKLTRAEPPLDPEPAQTPALEAGVPPLAAPGADLPPVNTDK